VVLDAPGKDFVWWQEVSIIGKLATSYAMRKDATTGSLVTDYDYSDCWYTYQYWVVDQTPSATSLSLVKQ
jgi:hypothetical protein